MDNISKVSGEDQSDVVGSELANPFIVKVEDRDSHLFCNG